MQNFAESILEWIKTQRWFDYFNWLLAQPSSEATGIIMVVAVLVVAVVIVVWVTWR